jgi:hypothetical protein
MSDTPRTDAAEIVQIFVNHPELRTNRVPTEFARQLERELAELTEALAEKGQLAIDMRNQRNRAITARDAERALADRLAASLDISQEHHAEGTDIPYDEAHTAERALEAWKEARRE